MMGQGPTYPTIPHARVLTSALRALAAAMPAFLTLACESSPVASPDPEPCDAPHACQVAGVDVALLSVLPRWTAEQPYEAEAGAHVVEPGDTVVVDVVVVNRGTVAATDSILVYGYFRDFQHFASAGTNIGPLGVGEETTVTLRFAVPEGTRWMRQWQTNQPAYTIAEGFIGLAGDFEADDVDPTNHVGATVGYQPRTALLEVHEAETGPLRSHTSYVHYVTVTNHSPFIDYAGGGELVFCMSYVAHAYCESGLIDAHSPTTIGAVAAGDGQSFETTLEFTGASLWYLESENLVMLNPCLAGTAPLRCLHAGDFEHDFDTRAVTDLRQECATAALVPPDTLRALNAYCLGHGGDGGFAFSIGVFEGQAGECYRITALADDWNVRIRHLDLAPVNRDVAGNCFPLPADGTYYLIASDPLPSDPAAAAFLIEPT